jgi:hypothetical protein
MSQLASKVAFCGVNNRGWKLSTPNAAAQGTVASILYSEPQPHESYRLPRPLPKIIKVMVTNIVGVEVEAAFAAFGPPS